MPKTTEASGGTPPRCVDLNADAGESFGAYEYGADEALLSHVTSVNVACGFHAGDPAVMRRTVRAAAAAGVAIGAHPSFPDLNGFGRREMRVDPEDLVSLLIYQIGALAAIARVEGTGIRHVKPHGALYSMAAREPAMADAVADAVAAVDRRLRLVAPPASLLVSAGARAGLAVALEGFADRTYQPDGSLTPRTRPDALITDPDRAADQAVRLVREGGIDTLCVHGDTPGAAGIARAVRSRLHEAGILIRALDGS